MTLEKESPAFQEPELDEAKEQGCQIPESERVRADGRDNEATPKYPGREQRRVGGQNVSFAQMVGMYGKAVGAVED
ncbi:hypothetical protein GSI_02084 [Ganoderma sinense ZZ0214-1]|uniref:Uncharacterized protein n=1 Tax=Ganoderma sinense ZZ0214-1 TaxID=1077348 RepID=A0A2G8SP61_9APHY|nr:hypothetical protein GSI_02084 [Ganoderma sinense ZZ0214-1]